MALGNGFTGFKRWVIVAGCMLLSGCFQAQLNGPIAGTTVTIAPLDNPDQVISTPRPVTSWDENFLQTFSGGKLWENPLTRIFWLGIFQLNISTLDDNTLYLVTANGGFDTDADGNRFVDPTYTPVNGEWRAIMTGAQLKGAGPKVTPLSEAAYLWLESRLGDLNSDQIMNNLNRAAVALVGDLDKDGNVDYDDLLLYSPQLHKLLNPTTSAPLVKQIADSVTAGSSGSARSGVANQLVSLDVSEDVGTTPQSYFDQHVADAVVICTACHVDGGIAVNGGARLSFGAPGGDPAGYEAALQDFVTSIAGGGELLLSKARGVAHGGSSAVTYTSQSNEYGYLATYVGLVSGDSGGGGNDPVSDFWEGIIMADARQTLRRAALVFAGRLPTDAEYAQAESGDAGLRAAIRSLLEGSGFHDFLITGANDRLHTDGLMNGVPFDLLDDNLGFYPEYTNLTYALRTGDNPEEEWRWRDRFNYGMSRSPLELIAHVVESDNPYTEILTAQYMMVNPFMTQVLNTGAQHPSDDPGDFRRGVMGAQIVQDDNYVNEFTQDNGTYVISHSGYIDYPHAGVLNSMAYLGRYPTTETNRNRARSRWTYLHFLDTDIEKSAARTTDPDALADTNNPTLYNPACTVCHEQMDPIAGTFQNYGNEGVYRSSWGGMDSLPDTYKWPEVRFDGSSQSIDITGAEFQRRDYQATGETRAGQRYVGIQFTNPGEEEGEDIPRGVAIYDVSVRQNGQEIFSAFTHELWGMSGADVNGWEWGDGIALAFESSFISFPVDVPANGELTLVFNAEGNALSDGTPPNVQVTFMLDDPAPYEEGDTWFRDMRPPGLPGEVTNRKNDSLRWLGSRIANDPRFARATVKFWWQAVMGADVLEAPGSASDVGYQQLLRAFEQQTVDIQDLAESFEGGFNGGAAYNLKDLLVEMAMTGWFRATAMEPGADSGRERELETVGARRLLTPLQLQNKMNAVAGFRWQEWEDEWQIDGVYTAMTDRYRVYYGGIDSVGVKDRARQLTTLMSNVATRQAVEMACPAVVLDFGRDENDRQLFPGLSYTTVPGEEGSQSFSTPANYDERTVYSLTVDMQPGDKKLRVRFDNSYWDEVFEEGRNIFIDSVTIRRGNQVIQTIEGENFRSTPGFEMLIEYGENGEVWDSGSEHWEEVRPGDWREVGWVIWSWLGWISLPIEADEAGEYTVEVTAWGARTRDNVPAEMTIAVLDNDPYSDTTSSRQIKETIQHLHAFMLGEERDLDDPEIDAAYRLLVETWLDRKENMPNATGTWQWPDEDCFMPEGFWERDQALIDADTSDPELMKGSWVSVVMYFMTHYSFLHE